MIPGWVSTLSLPWFYNNDIQHTEETYINKKLSDCLVGVFGVDSEKGKLIYDSTIEEKNPTWEGKVHQAGEGGGWGGGASRGGN